MPKKTKPSTWARLSTVATFRHVVGVGAVLLFSAAGCGPVPPEALQQLPPDQARELTVYSSQHSVVFDPRIHSLETCPFLAYVPQYAFSRHDTREFAAWLHQFYTQKHEEEQSIWGCTCNQELIAPAETRSTPRR